ncbi:hypothetical protein [Salinigranum marinum]|uniref:hypothetical protein n=1 Tax=Salinigranum marinum TaxID=1515595 RepID=UPI002989AF3E|nr:hypothetical protein [Salinigranum marinum]
MKFVRRLALLAAVAVVGLGVGGLVVLVGTLDVAAALVVAFVAGLLLGGVVAGLRWAGRSDTPYW